MKCERCEGRGFYFCAPEGVNPFNVRLPTLARILERKLCRCGATMSPSDALEFELSARRPMDP